MHYFTDANTDNGQTNFFEAYEIQSRSAENALILSLYYALTTLSTVGFGDIHPKTNLERLVVVVIFLVGLVTLSLITQNFMAVAMKLN
jgi:K+-sensing histidine kinase KdpD